jgi:hypothetical protein
VCANIIHTRTFGGQWSGLQVWGRPILARIVVFVRNYLFVLDRGFENCFSDFENDDDNPYRVDKRDEVCGVCAFHRGHYDSSHFGD